MVKQYILDIIDDTHIDTIFGVCHLSQDNHYRLNNHNYDSRLLHRLIWEDAHNSKVPKGYVIHHRDFNSLNNNIENLVLLTESEHRALHMKHRWNNGIKFDEEWKKKLSESHKGYKMSQQQKIRIGEKNNKTGILRVYKKKERKNTQGFTWKYEYYDEKGKKRFISSIRIRELRDKILSKNLEWIIIDEEKMKQTFKYDKQIEARYYG